MTSYMGSKTTVRLLNSLRAKQAVEKVPLPPNSAKELMLWHYNGIRYAQKLQTKYKVLHQY